MTMFSTSLRPGTGIPGPYIGAWSVAKLIHPFTSSLAALGRNMMPEISFCPPHCLSAVSTPTANSLCWSSSMTAVHPSTLRSVTPTSDVGVDGTSVRQAAQTGRFGLSTPFDVDPPRPTTGIEILRSMIYRATSRREQGTLPLQLSACAPVSAPRPEPKSLHDSLHGVRPVSSLLAPPLAPAQAPGKHTSCVPGRARPLPLSHTPMPHQILNCTHSQRTQPCAAN